MDIKVTTAGPVATMHMSGRFDFNVHRSFKESYDALLPQKGVSSIEVDLSQVEYLDSSALGMLLMLRERAQAEGKDIVLAKPTTTVAQILDIANFGKMFTIR